MSNRAGQLGRTLTLWVLSSGLVAGWGCAAGAPTLPRPPRTLVLQFPGADVQPDSNAAALRDALSNGRWIRALAAADLIFEDGRLIDTGVEQVDPAFFVIRLLSGQPPAFLEAYRRRWDGRSSVSTAIPRTVPEWARRFYAKGMDEVGDDWALRSFDRGDPARALRIWKAIYDHHPDPAIPRDLLAARIILAAAACSSPEETSQLEASEDYVQVGERKHRLSEWKALAFRSPPRGRRADWTLFDSTPVTVGPVTVEPIRRGDVWGISIRREDRRAELFTADAFLMPFLRVVIWTTGETLGWASTAGVGGEWDVAEWRPTWSGPSSKRRPPSDIVVEVAELLSAQRHECMRRLEIWAGQKRSLIRNWHSCDSDQGRADLLATSAGAFWICPCGQVTPMDLRGVRSVSLPGIRALELPDPAQKALDRARQTD